MTTPRISEQEQTVRARASMGAARTRACHLLDGTQNLPAGPLHACNNEQKNIQEQSLKRYVRISK